MKKILTLFLIILWGKVHSQQGVGVADTPPATPDPSAILDLRSVTKGFLMPRYTTAAKLLIPSPARGLTVLDTTIWCISIYGGSGVWKNMCPRNCPNGSIDFGAFGTEVVLHGVRNFEDAASYCDSIGARLCTFAELSVACKSGLIPGMGNDWEWVDDSPQENNLLIFGGLGCGTTLMRTKTTDTFFRCCCEH